MTEINEENTLLLGVVGSHAYGLNHEGSDIDLLGIYAAPTRAFHGLNPPVGKYASTVTHEPDITFHEAAKFASLALKCNPTVMELLWLEEDAYRTVHPLGRLLIRRRTSFLSRKLVRNAYLGYATEQIKRLGSPERSLTEEQRAKLGRHASRLLFQGTWLYKDALLPLLLTDTAKERVRAHGEQAAKGDLEPLREEMAWAESVFDSRSPLPETPNEDVVTAWLYWVRDCFYDDGSNRE